MIVAPSTWHPILTQGYGYRQSQKSFFNLIKLSNLKWAVRTNYPLAACTHSLRRAQMIKITLNQLLQRQRRNEVDREETCPWC